MFILHYKLYLGENYTWGGQQLKDSSWHFKIFFCLFSEKESNMGGNLQTTKDFMVRGSETKNMSQIYIKVIYNKSWAIKVTSFSKIITEVRHWQVIRINLRLPPKNCEIAIGVFVADQGYFEEIRKRNQN